MLSDCITAFSKTIKLRHFEVWQFCYDECLIRWKYFMLRGTNKPFILSIVEPVSGNLYIIRILYLHASVAIKPYTPICVYCKCVRCVVERERKKKRETEKENKDSSHIDNFYCFIMHVYINLKERYLNITRT
jgi:hypothetical protein